MRGAESPRSARRVVAPHRPVDDARVLGEVARLQGRHCPDAIAFQFEGRTVTYAELDRRANQIARALIAIGAPRGARLCYLGKNSDTFFELLFGAAKAGWVLTPINWRLSGAEIAYILNDCSARILCIGQEFAELIREIRAMLPLSLRCIEVENRTGGASYEHWLGSQRSSEASVAHASPQDVVLQLYTSGTTGRPKGAMLTHDSLLALRPASGEEVDEWRLWTESDVALVAMPVFHIGGIGWGLMSFVNGARAVIAREFAAQHVLDFIERDRVSKLFLVPSALRIVLSDPRSRRVDFSRVRYIFYGASPMPLDLLRECRNVFGCSFVQMYGMTETAGTIVALGPEDHGPDAGPRIRSAGKALPGVEIGVVDHEGRRAPAGVVGEIVTRSAANMVGYWNLPEPTTSCIDAHGWLRTGDLGSLDEAGYLYLQDRVKDVIISGGENIYPTEVENVLHEHPDIAEAAVIGVPDEKWGESVKAIVVAKSGRKLHAAEIMAWTRRHLAAFKSPRSVDFIPALPRNAAGKILRRELRKPYWEGRDRGVN
jgi:acyl-CoA synthetase (AMP-forming)/AMP-acid ligase II